MMKRTIIAIVLGLAVSGLVKAVAQNAATMPQLTAQERRGRAIYLRGEGTGPGGMVAFIGELEVPASTLACAGCHGAHGEGKTEGGVTAGSLVWSQLLKSDGHTHPTGRKHGPFTEASFIRAVAEGLDPAGNKLLVAMPRYRMSAEEMAELIAYLKRIETDYAPGINDTSIEVGVVLPSKGPLVEMGESMRAVIAAYFEDLNTRGGVYNRRITLRVVEPTGTALLAQNRNVFAYVGGISAGADAELAKLAREQEIPFVGLSTLMPDEEKPLNRHLFYLLSGVKEQARALANFAASKAESKKARTAVVYGEGVIAVAAATAAEEQLKKAGVETVIRKTYKELGGDGAMAARQLKQSGIESVFLFGVGGGNAALVTEANALGWTPRLFMVSVLDGTELLGSTPATFKDRVFISFPTVPADVTTAGLAEFRPLLEKYKVTPRHIAAQLMAFAAAKVFTEGLKRAGQDLTRERLITALEGLYDFETGVTPPLTFGPNRRIGATGAYIITIDPVKKEYVPASGWVAAF